MSFFHLFTLLS